MTTVESTPLVGGPSVVLDTGVPWPRTAEDVAREWARVEARYARLLVTGRRSMSQLTSGERFIVGVRAAARWTRGESARSPLRLANEPVSGQAVRDELAVAESLMEGRGRNWEAATGVLHWLLWVTGATDDLPYPEA